MIIKNNSTKLITIISFLIVIPFVQKQWSNLYLFNNNEVSFYSFLYYLSGIICPALICLNSLNNFTYYNFSSNKINGKKIIKGKALLAFVTINLILLSYLIADYIYINFDFINNLFLEGNRSQEFDIFQFSFFITIIAILLILKKSRHFFKKLILVNFIMISFSIWYIQINNVTVTDQFHINKYFALFDLNLINVFILTAIEILYFTWSFLSYKNKLSDWMVQIPSKEDYKHVFNILIFYFFIIIYYFLLA